MTSNLDPTNPYATVRSTHSGWSESAHSPQKVHNRLRTTSVHMLSSEDELEDNNHTKSSFQIVWRNSSFSEETPEEDASRVVEGSEDAPVVVLPERTFLDQCRLLIPPDSYLAANDDFTSDLNAEMSIRYK